MRLFIAVELEPSVRQVAAEVSQALRDALGEEAKRFSFSRPESMHQTLAFLGSTPDEQVPYVQRALSAVATHRPFALRLGGTGAFPTARRPRVLWLGLSKGEEELGALAATIEQPLADLGFPAPRRRFRAHLTLARHRYRYGAPDVTAALASLQVPPASMVVREVVLFESRLQPGGAVHTPLHRVALAG